MVAKQVRRVAPQRNYRFQLKAEHEVEKVDPVLGRVPVCTKTLCVRSSSVKGAYMKLRKHFNDVSQFVLIS